MENPRPDIKDVRTTLENKTGGVWSIIENDPDILSLQKNQYKLEIVWDGDFWTLNLYDFEGQHGEEAPKWAQGPMYNAKEIKKELPSFISVIE